MRHLQVLLASAITTILHYIVEHMSFTLFNNKNPHDIIKQVVFIHVDPENNSIGCCN